MKNNEVTREILSQVIFDELKDLSVALDGLMLSKYLYMFKTGVEMVTKSGAVSKPPPIGPFLGWMIKVYQGEYAPSDGIDPYVKIRFTGEFLNDLVKEAQSSDIAWQAAKELGGWFLRFENSVPCILHSFLVGEKPERKQGRHPLEKLHRDLCVVMLLNGIVNAGFQPVSRNPDPIYKNSFSLCDVMERALQLLPINISFDGVRAIWTKRKQLSQYLPEFSISIESDKDGTWCYMTYMDRKFFERSFQFESQAKARFLLFLKIIPVSPATH
jgi:hypothetical protein